MFLSNSSLSCNSWQINSPLPKLSQHTLFQKKGLQSQRKKQSCLGKRLQVRAAGDDEELKEVEDIVGIKLEFTESGDGIVKYRVQWKDENLNQTWEEGQDLSEDVVTKGKEKQMSRRGRICLKMWSQKAKKNKCPGGVGFV
eukprot:TRINITY_DN8854_c0_g1_i1.p1 TRINITY_DN8854_c0_g1~~TRINITY_DN8854_c0_g1_i1.p1  ORF type:complete len:157 (+),score=22.19 TRINITY_DN8854_c0_g1_i1:49-471(+)